MFDPSKFDQLRELVDNDPNELADLVREYENNALGLMQQIRDAHAQKRGHDIYRAAHTLKSSSALLGAAAVAERCEGLEEQTRDGRYPADAAARVQALDDALAEALRWLHRQLAT